jgi:hypothetical protein
LKAVLLHVNVVTSKLMVAIVFTVADSPKLACAQEPEPPLQLAASASTGESTAKAGSAASANAAASVPSRLMIFRFIQKTRLCCVWQTRGQPGYKKRRGLHQVIQKDPPMTQVIDGLFTQILT